MVVRSFVRSVVLLAVLLAASPVFADGLQPAEPQGYSWRDFGFMKALSPEGWFVKTQDALNAKAVFISKESIDKESKYSTGFSAKALKNIPKLEKMQPSEYTKAFVGGMPAANRLGQVQAVDQPPFKGYQVLTRTRMPSGDYSVVFTTVLGNDATGSVFVLVFESPEAAWSETGTVGRSILKSVVLDEKY